MGAIRLLQYFLDVARLADGERSSRRTGRRLPQDDAGIRSTFNTVLRFAWIMIASKGVDRMLPKERADWPDQVQIDERLIEMDYGPYEGMGLKNPPPEIIAFFSDFQNTPAPDGMEPLEKVVERSGQFLEDIREEAAQKNILISTHAIAMKGLLEYLTPESHGAYWSKYVGNCDVYTAEVTAEGYTVPKELEGPGASAREVGC